MSDKGVKYTGIAGIFIFLIAIVWWSFVAGLSLYGVFLAFSASIVLGFCCFIVPPIFLLSGALKFFFHFDLPQKILELVGK